ncbi:MAG: monooxygenase, FAD-binding [uncultured Truepera sp.]|uniref:Monooxygenase, FAD-binding n=1 Tax=uncultured Truepera sp. TaxID=543023 RepID=A0A6J4VXE7_9DEIN|nr:MAG: monooxygenase, FAD-binding [uncultured Truepera sp.]
MNYDVIIAGASFAGLACAKVLAQRGCSVRVLERRADPGTGLHTTGILVHEAAELLELPAELYKPISQVRLYGPSLRHIELASSGYSFLATDTPALMRHLIQDAVESGAHFTLGTAFTHGKETGGRVIVNRGLASCRLLVGADGARSRVAATFALGQNRRFLLGVEVEYTGLTVDNPEAFHCFLDQRYAPGYIGWVIPGPKVMQVGLAAHHTQKPDMAAFTRHIAPLLHSQRPRIVGRRGGLIPVGGLAGPFCNDKVILVGDAAGTVSPLTAGGIHTALHYGNRLGELAAAYLHKNGPHPGDVLKHEYPRFQHKLLFRELFNRTPNWCFDAAIASPFAQPTAKAVFFLKKRLPPR